MPFPGDDDFNDLCMRIGFALAVWQRVEEAHYDLFLDMLEVPDGSVPSVVYFSVESFDARRKMVGRMAHYYLKTSEQKKEWGEIDKQLKDMNGNRNKLAHYGIEVEVIVHDTPSEDRLGMLEFGGARVQPSRRNRVNELLGRTPDRDIHNLNAEMIDAYIISFSAAAQRIQQFNNGLRSQRDARYPLPARMLRGVRPLVSPPPPMNQRPIDTEES
jgi:hypothetical protein